MKPIRYCLKRYKLKKILKKFSENIKNKEKQEKTKKKICDVQQTIN
tara:strand:- start:1041 stop:1178 length:138 start_codon:yes stop_codon:yes gene_type:complete